MSPWGKYFLEWVMIRADGKLAGIDNCEDTFAGDWNRDLTTGLSWLWVGTRRDAHHYLSLLCEWSLEVDGQGCPL